MLGIKVGIVPYCLPIYQPIQFNSTQLVFLSSSSSLNTTMPSEYQLQGRTQYSWTSPDALQNLRLNTNVPKPTNVPKGHALVRIKAAALNARDMMVSRFDSQRPSCSLLSPIFINSTNPTQIHFTQLKSTRILIMYPGRRPRPRLPRPSHRQPCPLCRRRRHRRTGWRRE